MLPTLTVSGTHGVGRSAPRRDASLTASQVIDSFVIGTSQCHRSLTPTAHSPQSTVTATRREHAFTGFTDNQLRNRYST